MEEKIRHLLTSVVHPETGQDIVGSGFIEHIASGAGKITVVLRFAKARDPFAVKIKNQAEEILRREFPQQNVMVVIKEGGAAPRLILQSAHPSPLSSYRGFFGSRPFSRINAFLRENGEAEIDWQID